MSKENLKEYIHKFVKLEEEEDKYKEILNDIKKKKESVSNSLIQIMEESNITDKDIIFGNKKIKYFSTKVQDSITKTLIKTRLQLYFNNDEAKSNDLTNFIYNDRNYSIKNNLKISIVK